MIRPDGMVGAAFGTAVDGDGRFDSLSRSNIASALGISVDWATMDQVHGSDVVVVDQPGPQGTADAMFTSISDLPLVVAAADCVPVAVEGDGVAAVVHAGWRGMASGIIAGLRRAVADAGFTLARAAIGPSVGPCCYEVGPEVAAVLTGHEARTNQGTLSVDLWGAARGQLDGLDIWVAEICTMCGDGFHSHRADGTAERQIALAWLPSA